jgi:selenide,water dikinase
MVDLRKAQTSVAEEELDDPPTLEDSLLDDGQGSPGSIGGKRSMSQDSNEPTATKKHKSSTQEYVKFDPKECGLEEDFKLTKFSEFRARRSKVSIGVIDNMLKGFMDKNTDPTKNSLLGLSMDASILPARHGGLTLLQAQEVLYPCIEDPYLLGRISCATILSSMYALGVTELDNMLMKLSVSNLLKDNERDVVVPLMIKGFRDCATEAGTKITGGETVVNPWCMIGGVATAVCSSSEYIIPDKCNAGDVLVLTKPLGTQIALNCMNWLQNPVAWGKVKLVISPEEAKKSYARALDSMSKMNMGAAKLMHKFKAHAATAIGGFGLLGHAMALARCQKNEVSFVIHNLPVIAKMASVAKAKGTMFQLAQGLACELSGGLLICLPREQAAAFCKDIEANDGNQAWIIGIVEKGDRSARIIDKPRIIEVPSKDREGELW